MTQLTKRERLDRLEEEIRDHLAEDAAPKWTGTGRPPVGRSGNKRTVEAVSMNDELLNRRVLREISKAGRPISCYAIKELLRDRLSDVRGALEQLMKDGDVVAVGALYVRAHGGCGPGPERAA